MYKSIWKFSFTSDKNPEVFLMPKNAEILCIKTQNETPTIWALVDIGDDIDKEERCFEIYGTGWNINEDDIRKYVGTFFAGGENLVFHVFELKAW